MPATIKPRQEVCLGPAGAVPAGEGRVYCVAGERIALFRERDGKLYAVQSDCPHERGPLADGITGGGKLICPLHSWTFDLASGACLNDPSHCLRTYPVREADGQVFVTV